MSKEGDIPVFPVSGWKIGPLPGYDALVLKFQYLASPLQPIEEAEETIFYGLTPEIARGLISDLQKHIEAVEKSASLPHPEAKH
ncbi:bssS family protein [Acerihabitans sp. KWT182]|uniref:BssS family protein n=1 Tax=Acerihabitans sp. KWT182 TaxID=3157919 RepID=A0AAU7QEQ1_9GAMM